MNEVRFNDEQQPDSTYEFDQLLLKSKRLAELFSDFVKDHDEHHKFVDGTTQMSINDILKRINRIEKYIDVINDTFVPLTPHEQTQWEVISNATNVEQIRKVLKAFNE